MSTPSPLRALSLPVADLLVAALLYDRVWTGAAVLLAAVGALVLGSVLYRLSVGAGPWLAAAAE